MANVGLAIDAGSWLPQALLASILGPPRYNLRPRNETKRVPNGRCCALSNASSRLSRMLIAPQEPTTLTLRFRALLPINNEPDGENSKNTSKAQKQVFFFPDAMSCVAAYSSFTASREGVAHSRSALFLQQRQQVARTTAGDGWRRTDRPKSPPKNGAKKAVCKPHKRSTRARFRAMGAVSMAYRRAVRVFLQEKQGRSPPQENLSLT